MQLQGSVQWVIDGLMGFLDALFTPLANAMGTILKDIADFTVLVPHPEWTSAEQVMSAPDGGLWLTLWEVHWNVMVPSSLAILIAAWFARQAGVAANLVGAEESARSGRNLARGFGIILISWWIVGAYLNLAHALTALVTPDSAAMAAAIPDIGVATVIAAAFYYLELTVGSTLFILLILVNVVRLIAIYGFVILFPILAAVYYANIPVLSDMFKSFGDKLATTAVWTFPVAAGWRIMATLAASDEGILESILASSGVGVGVVDSIINPFLIMIPAIIGIAAPLLMSNVSQMYYLSNMADVNMGADAAGTGGGGAGASAGGATAAGTGGATAAGTGGAVSGGGAGGGARVSGDQNTLGDYGQGDGRTSSDIKKGGPPGERQTAVRDALSGTKESFDALDENSSAIDWENVDKTKDRARAAGGAAKQAGSVLHDELQEGASDWKDIFTEDGPEEIDADEVDPDRAGLQYGHRRAEGHDTPDWIDDPESTDAGESPDSADGADGDAEASTNNLDVSDSPSVSTDTFADNGDSMDDGEGHATGSPDTGSGASDPFQEMAENGPDATPDEQQSLNDVFDDSPNTSETTEETESTDESPESPGSSDDRPVPDWVREEEEGQ